MVARSELQFQAAVERPLSVVFRTPEGAWEGHDYKVEVVTARQGLDAVDVVMDFRDLEAALDAWLAPLHGRLLSEAGLQGPADLAQRLLEELAPKVPAPARIVEVALIDGRGYRLSIQPDPPSGNR
jgi:6-pyruvoyl-tetrahydropterin synthase